jgi:hypothetical protein
VELADLVPEFHSEPAGKSMAGARRLLPFLLADVLQHLFPQKTVPFGLIPVTVYPR